MLLIALKVAIITGLAVWPNQGWASIGSNRPIVIGPLVGLLLGDLTTGLIVGGTIELIYLGVFGVGAAVPPDPALGTAIATTLCIVSGIETNAAVLLAIPVASLSQIIEMFIWTLNIGIIHRGDKVVEKGDINKLDSLQYLGSFLFFLSGVIPAFIGTYLGVTVVEKILNYIPQWFLNGLSIAGGILPALGFALLFTMTGSKKLQPFFYIGFVLAAFLKLSLVGVAIIGAAASVLYIHSMEKQNTINLS